MGNFVGLKIPALRDFSEGSKETLGSALVKRKEFDGSDSMHLVRVVSNARNEIHTASKSGETIGDKVS